MLDDYVAEFRSLHTELQRLLDNAGVGNGSQAEIESKMRELKDCLGALEMELRSMSPAQRSSYFNQIQKCRDEFAALQRRCLLSTSRAQETSAATERTRCGHALEKLNSANMQLENTRKLADETEAVGANVLCNLYMQRESIQRANRHAEQTNASLRESSSLISKMGKWWSGLIG